MEGQVDWLCSSTFTAPSAFNSTPAASRPSPSVLGTRPVANINMSQSTGSPLPRWTLKDPSAFRSEEPTSELQSLMRHSYAVFCLKKKKKHKITHYITYSLFHTTI